MNMYSFKEASRRLVNPLMKLAMHFTPNTITLFSLVWAASACWSFYRADLSWTLWTGIGCILLRLACNLLDGMVARERKMSSPKGEALQEAVDRIADTMILSGIVFSPFGHPVAGFLAVPAMLIGSYLGILSKAVGGERVYAGIMSKVDRMTLIMIFSVIQFFWRGTFRGFHAFGILLCIILAGCLITIVQRTLIIRRAD